MSTSENSPWLSPSQREFLSPLTRARHFQQTGGEISGKDPCIETSIPLDSIQGICRLAGAGVALTKRNRNFAATIISTALKPPKKLVAEIKDWATK